MKVKDIVKIPECKTGHTWTSAKQDLISTGYNQAIKEIGELEVASLDEESVIDCMVLGLKDETYREQVRDFAKAICAKFPLPQRMELDEKELLNFIDSEPLEDAGIGGHKVKAWCCIKSANLAKAICLRFAKPVSCEHEYITKGIHALEAICRHCGEPPCTNVTKQPIKEELDEKSLEKFIEEYDPHGFYNIPLDFAKTICSKFAVTAKPETVRLPSITQIKDIMDEVLLNHPKHSMPNHLKYATSIVEFLKEGSK